MEVPGQLADASKETTNLICIPCDKDGLRESAYGYCQDCEEHLCESCYKHHRKSKPSRNHVLLDKDTMPQQPMSGKVRSDDTPDFCTNHSDKMLEFFCNKHGSAACYVCVTLEHKHCSVDYIPDVSGSISDEFKDLTDRMEKLIEKCKSNARLAENATVNLDQIYKKVVEDIKLFRKEINQYLDGLEADITRESKARAYTAKCKQENVKAENLQIAEEVSCSLSLLNSLNDESKKNKLFLEIKSVEPRLAKLSDKEKQTVEDKTDDGNVTFIRNDKILDQLKREVCFGNISIPKKYSEDRPISVEYKGTVDIQSSSDKESCDCYSMVFVSASQMIVADYSNKKIKSINVDNKTLISEITLSSQPRDVIKLSQNKLAVALPNENTIQIMSYTDTSLTLDHRIDVGDTCYCVAYCNGKLVVGCNCNPGKIIIMDLDGNIIQVFDTPGLFAGPQKIIVSSDEKFLYITDYNWAGESKCMKMDWQGNIVQTFKEQGYKRPLGIQELEDGSLWVCCSNSDNMVRLSSSFKRCEIIGLEKEKIYNPTAIAYNERHQKLYISSSNTHFSPCDLIKIFNIKWM